MTTTERVNEWINKYEDMSSFESDSLHRDAYLIISTLMEEMGDVETLLAQAKELAEALEKIANDVWLDIDARNIAKEALEVLR